MKLLLSWLNDYTDISGVTTSEYADALTMSGSKVEGIQTLGEDIQNVVVGKILKKEKHPNADTLWVCQVDLGEEVTQIVTGAQNIEQGNLVPIAKHGSKLPGGIEIKSGKLRGETSNGMMCSHEELGLEFCDTKGANLDGILILQNQYPLGQDIKEVLDLSDSVIEFEITSNRPDCLSVIGIARETAATLEKKLNIKPPKTTGNHEKTEDYINVTIKDTDLCTRYIARAVKNIKISPSPKWLRDRLKGSCVRPINNIVDITNYVMLEYGQPMHAFDKSFLTGNEIIIRRASDGEIIKTLDDVERKLNESNLVIADSKRAVAVAGVMGGENSEINENTKELIFESAMFNSASVRLTAKKLGIRTEASSLYEKGLDPENCLAAVNRACELIEDLGAGEVIGGMIDIYPIKKEPRVLSLNPSKINEFLGTKLPAEFMIKALNSLDFEIDEAKMKVKVPTFRDDVESFADIAEEIARLYGYNKIESTPLKGEITVGSKTFEQIMEDKISNILCDLGYYETITYSFTHPASLNKLLRGKELQNCIKIINPLGEENSIMRNNLMHSTLEILSFNFKQRNTETKIFEIGKVYIPHALPLTKLPNEIKNICIGAFGKGDFFTLKGAIEDLFSAIGVNDYEFSINSENPSFHPGKTADIIIGGKVCGILGEVHPDVAENYEIDGDVYLAEIHFDSILSAISKEKKYIKLNRFPSVNRDIAIIVDYDIPAHEIYKTIKKYAGKSLENLHLFDVYEGAQIPKGKKSMAYAATFRASDRTLNENDISKIMGKLVKMLSKDLGAELR